MDFNAGEIVLLLVLAIVLFGPEKLPELARKAARLLHHFRRIANDAQGRLRQELGPEFADLELSDLNPRSFVAKHLGPDATAELDDIAKELKGARTSIDDALHADGGAADDDGSDAGGDQVAVPLAATVRVTPFDTEAT
ncbi:sec-independent translocase [Micropruina sp.]|uniref:sec-independent translocase n=1 Tax=Micropruina sp. TaxID=2737536 RepID=UPI0039E25DDA